MSQGAASGAGSFLSAVTALFDGFSTSAQLRGAAAVDTENARLTTLEGALQTEDIRRRGRATQGEALAALSGYGASVGGQSAQDLLFQNQLEIEHAVLNTRYSAASEARGLLMDAAAKKKQARDALIGGALRAGAAALGGVSNAMNRVDTSAARQRREQAYFPGALSLPAPSNSGSIGWGP